MDCMYCDQELNCTDYYGIGNLNRQDFEKQGDIYQCDNEDCKENGNSFYTKVNDTTLYEGYPC